jgi:hypothetical protein
MSAMSPDGPFSSNVVKDPVVHGDDAGELRKDKVRFWVVIAVVALAVLGLSFGLGFGLPKESNPKRPRGVGWQTADSLAPWCVATQYRYLVLVNGVASPYSLPSAPRQSLEFTNPIIEIPAGQEGITWQRSVDGGEWLPHALERKSDSDSEFVDTDNQCRALPGVPPVPEFKEFEADAGPGQVGWCLSTTYRYRYRAGGVVSAWSQQTVVPSNTGKRNPVLVATARPPYLVEWNASVTGGGFVWLGPGVFEVRFDYPVDRFSSWLVDMPREQWVLVTDVVARMNTAMQSTVFVSGSGRVANNVIPVQFISDPQNPNPARLYQITGPSMAGLGYDPTVVRSGTSIAETLPATRVTAASSQTQFVDRANPCTDVNGPLAPTGDRWAA